ncbi:hypothetical protein SGPA1_30068 [Streptomyces misionensis JCM 4497]
MGEVRGRHPAHRPGAGRRAAVLVRRGHHHRGRLHRLPRRVVAGADPGAGARRDGRREAAGPLGAPDPQPGGGAQGGPLAEAGRPLGARHRAAGRVAGDPRRPGAAPQEARARPAGPAHRPGGADAGARGEPAGAGRAAGAGAHRVRARDRGRGAGPHTDAVADDRPARPARHLDGGRGPGAVVLVRPGRGGRGPRRGPGQPPPAPLPADGELPEPGGDRRAGRPGARARHARLRVAHGRAVHRCRAALHRRTGVPGGHRAGRGRAAARAGGRHRRRGRRDEPARGGQTLAGRARRPGGGARQPGGQGPGVRRHGGRLARGDRGRVPGRAARALRGADAGHPAAHGGLRGPGRTGRGQGAGPAAGLIFL